MQRRIKSFDGYRINYDVVRKGNRFFVFLHGAGGDLSAWKKERAYLTKKGFSSIAIDLRGHGLSARPDLASDYSLEKFARDVSAVLYAEKVSEFILVGHCFGGMVAIEFHELFPRRVKAFVLVDTTYKAPQRLKFFFRQSAFLNSLTKRILSSSLLQRRAFKHVDFDRFVGTGDWNLRRIYSDISNTSFKSWLYTYQTLAQFDGIRSLRSIKQPVLIIEGEEDSIFDVLTAKKIKKLVKNSQLKIVPKANHILVITNPDVLSKEIEDYSRAIWKD